MLNSITHLNVWVAVPKANNGGSVIWKLENKNPKQTEIVNSWKDCAEGRNIPISRGASRWKHGRKET